jgi:hypothetical protein
MSFETLLREVKLLGEAERRKLLALMVAMEDRVSSGYAEMLARKIDDKTQGRWFTPEECERELGLADPS